MRTQLTTENQSSRLKFDFIDLFAGIGGFRIALESFGGECVFSSEWDKQAQITYEANFHDIPKGDITKINERAIPSHDVLCAGFPCQAFSISGKQRGFEDTRGTLFFDIARIAKFHKPKVIFLENVKNFARHDNGRTLNIIKNTLKSLGYDIFHGVLNASDYGIPQSRERIYIVAFRKDLKVKDFKFPAPTYKPVILKDYLQPNSEAKNQIIKLEKTSGIKFHDNPKKLRPAVYPKKRLSSIRIGTINGGGQGERIYSIEGHAITLSAHGGGIASKTGAYMVGNVIRKLTPYECSRIMGFPKTFKTPVSDSQAYKQFGNSVVIPIITRIFKSIMIVLEEIEQ